MHEKPQCARFRADTCICVCLLCPAQELGVTAVELLPPFEFDELEFQRIKSPRNHMARSAHIYTHLRSCVYLFADTSALMS
jgi:hypothetical protein